MVRRTSKSVKKHSKRNSHKAHSKRRNSKKMLKRSSKSSKSKQSLKGGAKRTSKRKTSKHRRNLKGGNPNPQPAPKRQQGGPANYLPESIFVHRDMFIPHLNMKAGQNNNIYPRPPGMNDYDWSIKVEEITAEDERMSMIPSSM